MNDEIRRPITRIRAGYRELAVVKRHLDALQFALRRHAIVRQSDFAVQNAEILTVPTVYVHTAILGGRHSHSRRRLRKLEPVLRALEFAVGVTRRASLT